MTGETKKRVQTFAFFILSALAVGGGAAFLTRNNMDIYDEINKPFLSPPGAVFPVVWTMLYVLMGISASLIWLKRYADKEKAENALLWYGASLVVNFIWSPVFFNFRNFAAALVILVLLLMLVLITINDYRRIFAPAAFLQIPYVLWICFAGYLNFSIWLLNG